MEYKEIIDRRNLDSLAALDELESNRVKRTLLRAHAIGFVAGAAVTSLVMLLARIGG